jgi:hypothetical protein
MNGRKIEDNERGESERKTEQETNKLQFTGQTLEVGASVTRMRQIERELACFDS